jgi:hypothetical protein
VFVSLCSRPENENSLNLLSESHENCCQFHSEHSSEQIGGWKFNYKVEMYPSREEFTELIYYISELKHQYSSKIDEQTIKINDQTGIIEELLWQIRELSDKLRQMGQKVVDMEMVVNESKQRAEEKSCICRYENHIPRNRSIFSRQTSMISARNSTKIATKGDRNGVLIEWPSIEFLILDKTVDDDDNDVYETIEFSDSSSSNLYTEPVRGEYGTLRKVNIKTSPRQQPTNKKKPTTLKKTNNSRNLQKFAVMQDVSVVKEENEESEPVVELRAKSPQVISTNPNCSLISVGKSLLPHHESLTNARLSQDVAVGSTHTGNLDSFIRPRDVSGILINFGCSSSRLRSDFRERLSY